MGGSVSVDRGCGVGWGERIEVQGETWRNATLNREEGDLRASSHCRRGSRRQGGDNGLLAAEMASWSPALIRTWRGEDPFVPCPCIRVKILPDLRLPPSRPIHKQLLVGISFSTQRYGVPLPIYGAGKGQTGLTP